MSSALILVIAAIRVISLRQELESGNLGCLAVFLRVHAVQWRWLDMGVCANAGLQSHTAKRTTSQIREHTRAKGSRARKVAAQALAIQLRLLVARLLPPVP